MISIRIVEKNGAPAGRACYEFRIKDNGIGMSEEFQKHIFEEFTREETPPSAAFRAPASACPSPRTLWT